MAHAHHKIGCQQCAGYGKCSAKTRLFVNYCGSTRGNIENHIRNALIDCRSHNGRLFKKNVLSGFYLKKQLKMGRIAA